MNDNPLINRALDASKRYRVGLYSGAELERALADALAAAGDKVPAVVRDAVAKAQALVREAERTLAVPDRPEAIEGILDELEDKLAGGRETFGER